MAADLVWYVAYGSNMDRNRLSTYLEGDLHLGSASTHPGARDRRPPLADAPHRLPFEVFFAGRSTRWDGAVAYCATGAGRYCATGPDGDSATGADGDSALGADGPPGPALGRRWLLRRSQLEDLVRQENRSAAPVAVDVDRCRASGYLDVAGGRYGRVVWLGEVDGVPALTATCAQPVTPHRPAGIAYLATIGRGLSQAWQLDLGDIARYLAARRGNAGHHDPLRLADELAALG